MLQQHLDSYFQLPAILLTLSHNDQGIKKPQYYDCFTENNIFTQKNFKTPQQLHEFSYVVSYNLFFTFATNTYNYIYFLLFFVISTV